MRLPRCETDEPRHADRSDGAPGRIRTCDQEIRRLLLYPLSYGGAQIYRTAPDSDVGAVDRMATWYLPQRTTASYGSTVR